MRQASYMSGVDTYRSISFQGAVALQALTVPRGDA